MTTTAQHGTPNAFKRIDGKVGVRIRRTSDLQGIAVGYQKDVVVEARNGGRSLCRVVCTAVRVGDADARLVSRIKALPDEWWTCGQCFEKNADRRPTCCKCGNNRPY